MSAPAANPPATTGHIPVRIELAPPLSGFAGSPSAIVLARRLESELDALLDQVGLRGSTEVQTTSGRSGRLVRLHVHDRLLPYHPNLLLRAWLAVAPHELRDLPVAAEAQARRGFAPAWLVEHLGANAVEAERVIARFLERLVQQAVLDRPSCLVADSQIDDFGRMLDPANPDPADAGGLLQTLLELGVSLRDRQLVHRVVGEGHEIGRSTVDTIEALFTELRTHKIEILVHPTTLAEILGDGMPGRDVSVYDDRIEEARTSLFRQFEETFFSAFGFVLPNLVWTASPALPDRMVAVKVGTWRGLPVPIPPKGKRLVLAPAEVLHEFGAVPAVDPVSGLRCSLVATELKEGLESKGYTTWGPVDFVIVVLGSELSQRAGTLLGMEEVEYQLAHVSAEPDGLLTENSLIALTKFSLGDLTRVMRALVAEHLSVFDLSGLLERLIQFDTVPVDAEQHELLVIDDRLPVQADASASWRSYYAFLRRQLKPHLSYFCSGDDWRIVGFTLDAEIEALVQANSNDVDNDPLEAVRDAVWSAFADLPAGRTNPIVTTMGARQAIRELLAPEFPDLPVLAYSELSPEVELEVAGEISLPIRA